jgi:hypothetical protein
MSRLTTDQFVSSQISPRVQRPCRTTAAHNGQRAADVLDYLKKKERKREKRTKLGGVFQRAGLISSADSA